MSFFAPVSQPAPLSMYSGTAGIYQQQSNNGIYLIIFAFFIMMGGILALYIYRLDVKDLGKPWLEDKTIDIDLKNIEAKQQIELAKLNK